MTRDYVIRMAREAGDDVDHTLQSDLDFLERFASLVAAAEREACASLCESLGGMSSNWHAESIRARGKA